MDIYIYIIDYIYVLCRNIMYTYMCIYIYIEHGEYIMSSYYN